MIWYHGDPASRATNDGPTVGLLVDDLDDISEIAASRILPLADFGRRGRPSVVDRAVRPNRPDDPVLFIVNLDQVLQHIRALTPARASRQRNCRPDLYTCVRKDCRALLRMRARD